MQKGFSLFELLIGFFIFSILTTIYIQWNHFKNNEVHLLKRQADLQAYTNAFLHFFKTHASPWDPTGEWYAFQDTKTRERYFRRHEESPCVFSIQVAKDDNSIYTASFFNSHNPTPLLKIKFTAGTNQ